MDMRRHVSKLLTVGVAMVALVGCSSGADELSLATTTTTSVPAESTPSTTTATSSTTGSSSTTLGEAQQRRLDEDAAVAEIEMVIEAWYTFPFDSSKGEEGVGAQYLTGLYRDRILSIAEADAEAGQAQRTRGNDRVEVVGVTLDLEAGTAEAMVCSKGDHELVDLETGEVIDADDPESSPGEGTYYATLTDDGWKLSEWFYSGQAEFKACEFSS